MERKRIFVEGPLIVGAGPGGLATAACLKKHGISSVILEKAECIASLWKLKTYDRLHLHLPKELCQLPHMPFPQSYPTYPNKKQFNSYLEDYVEAFELKPKFNEKVVHAEFDKECDVWRTVSLKENENGDETEYVSKLLVVASGENALEVMPCFEGMDDFDGQMFHSAQYRNGYMFKDNKVLVVGTGNSGMEIALDLANYHAKPTLAVRDSSHIWPREMLGISTFKVAAFLQKWFPLRVVDFLMFLITYLFLGDLSKFGIHRPKVGPLELKMKTGKTPVLDVGTLAKVREGKIKVIRGGIKKLLAYHSVEFMDGTIDNFDAIVLATGFKSNVHDWLKGTNFFSERTGYPLEQFSKECWKGPNGLYTVGFSKRGLLGVYMDALKVADNIVGI